MVPLFYKEITMSAIVDVTGKKMIKEPKCPFSLVVQYIVNMFSGDGIQYSIDLKCETCKFYDLTEKKCLIENLKKPTISVK